ncbi:hypothetical protein BH24CHL7_BH24CHL7_06890 [soil metagenome]
MMPGARLARWMMVLVAILVIAGLIFSTIRFAI